MRVLLIIPSLRTGGAEKFVCDLYNELYKKNGVEVFLLALGRKDESWKLCQNLINDDNFYFLGKKAGFDIRTYWKILAFIKKMKIDVVHAHLSAVPYILLSSIVFRKKKFIVTIHTDVYRESHGIARIHRWLLYKLNLAVPVTISEETKKSFEKLYKKQAFLIPNGISKIENIDNTLLSEFKGKKFVHIGRLHKVKNQYMLVRAFDILIKSGYDVSLIMIGRCVDSDVLSSIEPYFSDRIVWLGEQINPVRYLASADAFCLSSFMEGSPISALEAFSVGCPVISTPVGGCRSLITNGLGFLSKDCEVDSYADILKKFIDLSESEISIMRSNILNEFNMKFDISITVRNYLDIYKG